jgi:hypothetical protein
MPRTSKTEAPVVLDIPTLEIRQLDLDGYAVTFTRYKVDADPSPVFRGLPDDACQCPHWGVVLSGKVVFRYADHNETYTAGDVYYGAPGHVPLCFADSEVIEFSPAAELEKTMAAVGKNMQMAGHG